jgi:ribosome-associated heat shock protein Hsp15
VAQGVELARQRRPASEAVTFYDEAPESAERRRQRVEEQRAQRSARDHARPTKRDRRMIHRFTGASD